MYVPGAIVVLWIGTGLVLGACAGTDEPINRKGVLLSQAADASMLVVKAGSYAVGSCADEREKAYADYKRSSGKDTARRNGWFDKEEDCTRRNLAGFRFDRTPVTNQAYSEFVKQAGHRSPNMDYATWDKQGFVQKYPEEVIRYHWRGGKYSSARATHPVVLVSHSDARAYCRWRGKLVGAKRFLPSANEFEVVARGPGDSAYPWGAEFDASRLNSAASGERDTVSVALSLGKSPRGAVDMAGNVFQWTRSLWQGAGKKMIVKGSAWDDHAGLGRAAALHGRRPGIRHVIVGFRCAGPS